LQQQSKLYCGSDLTAAVDRSVSHKNKKSITAVTKSTQLIVSELTALSKKTLFFQKFHHRKNNLYIKAMQCPGRRTGMAQ